MRRDRSYPAGCRFFALPAEDDVKIFCGSAARPTEDDGAAEFVRERDNGNLARARQLGNTFAQKLVRLRRFGDSSRRLAQKKLLFAFAASRVTERQCGGSVLEQAVMGEFRRTVAAHSGADGSALQDSAAFTQYLLAERGGPRAVGGVFAQLCGGREGSTLQRRGEALYMEYTDFCTRQFRNICFE